MRFNVGGYYKHSGGGMMHVLVSLNTKIYGYTMLAEFDDGSFRPVGSDETNAINWVELDDVSEWHNKFN